MTALDFLLFFMSFVSVVAGIVIFYFWLDIMKKYVRDKKNETDGTVIQ